MDLRCENRELPVLVVYDVDATWASHEVAEATAETNRLVAALRRRGHSVRPLPLPDTDLAACLEPYDPEKYVVLNWCEGFPGVARSDHAVATALEALQFTYTGATGEVMALSRDKGAVKELLRRRGLPTPDWRLVPEGERPDWDIYPAIVKPAYEHSSTGMTPRSVVLDPAELAREVAAVHRKHRQPALVEEFIDGREFHVTLWGNGAIEMLPPAEMDFSAFADVRDRICSYDAKFTPTSDGYRRIRSLIPAPLGDDELHRLRETCVAGYRALGCRDYARLDVRLRDGEFQILDINPNADISRDTSFACAARLAGYSYGDLGSRIVRLAALRHPVFGQWSERPARPRDASTAQAPLRTNT